MKKRVLKTSIISMLCVAFISVFVGVGLTVKPEKANAENVTMSTEVQAIFDAFKNADHNVNVGYEVSYTTGKGIHVKVTNWTYGPYLNPLRFAINYNIDATKLNYYDKLISFTDTREILHDGTTADSLVKMQVAFAGGGRKNCLEMTNDTFKLYDDTWENGSAANAIYGGASSGAGTSAEFKNLGEIVSAGSNTFALYYDYNANGLYVSNKDYKSYNVVKLFDVDRNNYGNYCNPLTGEFFDSSKGANKNNAQSAKLGTIALTLSFFDCGAQGTKKPCYEFDIDAFGGIDLTNPMSTLATSQEKASSQVMSKEVKGIFDAFKNVDHNVNVGYEVSYTAGKGIHVKVTNWTYSPYLNPLRFAINYNIDATKLTCVDKLISFTDTREILHDGTMADSLVKMQVAFAGGGRKNCLEMTNDTFKLYDDTWENGSAANAIYGGASSGAGTSTEFKNLGEIVSAGSNTFALYYDYNSNGLYVSNKDYKNYNVVKLFDVDRNNYGNYYNPLTGEFFDSAKGANKNNAQSAKLGTIALTLSFFDCGVQGTKKPSYEFDIDAFGGIDLTNPMSTLQTSHDAVSDVLPTFHKITVIDEAITGGQKVENVSEDKVVTFDKKVGNVYTVGGVEKIFLGYQIGSKIYDKCELASDSTVSDFVLNKDISVSLVYVAKAEVAKSLKLSAQTDVGYTFTYNDLDVQTVTALGGKLTFNGENATLVNGKFEGVSETISNVNDNVDLVLAVELKYEGNETNTVINLLDATVTVKALANEKLANENIVRVADKDASNDHTYFITVDGTDFESILDVDGLKVLYGLADVAYAEIGYTYAA